MGQKVTKHEEEINALKEGQKAHQDHLVFLQNGTV